MKFEISLHFFTKKTSDLQVRTIVDLIICYLPHGKRRCFRYHLLRRFLASQYHFLGFEKLTSPYFVFHFLGFMIFVLPFSDRHCRFDTDLSRVLAFRLTF